VVGLSLLIIELDSSSC